MKMKCKRTIHSIEQKQAEEKHITVTNTVGAHTGHGGGQPRARAVQGGKKLNHYE